MTVQELSSDTFAEIVLGGSLPVLVEFWAPGCAPCQRLNPILRKLSEDYAGSLVVAKVDVDVNRELARKYNIASVPTIMIFRGPDRFVFPPNRHSKSAIIEYLTEYGLAPRGPA